MSTWSPPVPPCGVSHPHCLWIGHELTFPVIGKVGRRPLYLWGIGLMGLFMFILGIIGAVNPDNIAIIVGSMLVIIRITFKVTLGPCCCKSSRLPLSFGGDTALIALDTIVAETPSSRVRGQTMVLGRAGYVAGGIVMNQLKPRMLNEDGWVRSSTMHSVGAVTRLLTVTRTGVPSPVSSSSDSTSSSSSTCSSTCRRPGTERRPRSSTCSRRRSPAGSSSAPRSTVSRVLFCFSTKESVLCTDDHLAYDLAQTVGQDEGVVMASAVDVERQGAAPLTNAHHFARP